ncbi:MAG: VWA domain-containing protein, partial [Myxococcales bacterium]|nr:VWA domain-containing protein [Myxococcales bacterium]
MRTGFLAGALLLPGAGCSDGGGTTPPPTSSSTSETGMAAGTTGEGPPADSTSGSGPASGPGSTSGSSTGLGSTGDAPVFDLGVPDLPPGTCAPGEPGCGCTAVDVLLVLDVSGSMCGHMPYLVAAFPGFVDELFTRLPAGLSVHVGLTTSAFDDSGDLHGDGIATCANANGLDWLEQHYLTPDEGTL